MNEAILHAGPDKVRMTVVGQTHREKEREKEEVQTQAMSHISGRKMGCWGGVRENGIMKQTPQANEYHWGGLSLLTKMNQLPLGEKVVPQPQETGN